MSNNISVVIITLNEENTIGRCITSVQKISDDIIVIDANSTDNTREIALNHGAKVHIKPWEGYGQNKNFGNQKAIHDWILSIDADETINESLIQSIKNTKLDQHTIYSMLNQLIYCGHWVKYTDWHPSYKRRLFHKEHSSWNTKDIHEGLIVKNETSFIKLDGKILHYGYTSFEQLAKKTEHYARLAAQKMYNNNQRPSIMKYWFGPSFRFFKSYFLQLGILDGKAGYQIAKMNARLIRSRFIYLKELKKKQ